MSTTDRTPLTLTTVFSDNHGADQALVHDGPFSMSLLSTGPPQGPRDIAAGQRLQTPFHYDPSQGNLLIDWMRFDGGTPNPRIDTQAASTGGARVVLNQTSATALTGTLNNIPPVLQFEFAAVPEPSTIFLAFSACVCLFAWRRLC
jgi:hypothetical protein